MPFPFELAVDPGLLAILALVAFVAGFIDAIAGGGGLLTIELRSHRFAGVMPVLFLFAGVFLEGAWATFRQTVVPNLQRIDQRPVDRGDGL